MSNEMSNRELVRLGRKMQNNNVTEEDLQKVWDQLDDEQIETGIQAALDNFVTPRLEQVRRRAEEDQQADIRAQFAEMSDERQQELFDQAVDELIGACYELRSRPEDGIESLMGLLRDPYTVEALLLIFENEDNIDPEYSEQMKEFAATHLKWIGCALVPEAYPQREVADVYQTLGLQVRERPRR